MSNQNKDTPPTEIAAVKAAIEKHIGLVKKLSPSLEGLSDTIISHLVMQAIMISGPPGSSLREGWSNVIKEVDASWYAWRMMHID